MERSKWSYYLSGYHWRIVGGFIGLSPQPHGSLIQKGTEISIRFH